MSDQGFVPPPPRREPRPFEPPPWEREQFEQHAREQAEREAAAEAARARAIAEQEAAQTAKWAAEDAASAAGQAGATGAPEVGASPAAAASKGEVDENQVALMLLGLRAEEPAVLEGAWIVTVIASGVVMLVGLTIAIWGGAVLARPGLPTAGVLGGVVLLGFGLAFLGIGVWAAFRALRQQGVL